MISSRNINTIGVRSNIPSLMGYRRIGPINVSIPSLQKACICWEPISDESNDPIIIMKISDLIIGSILINPESDITASRVMARSNGEVTGCPLTKLTKLYAITIPKSSITGGLIDISNRENGFER